MKTFRLVNLVKSSKASNRTKTTKFEIFWPEILEKTQRNFPSSFQFFPLVDMWDESTQSTSPIAVETPPPPPPDLKIATANEVHNKLYKLSEKWKFDFFGTREANISNINDILESSQTSVDIDFDEENKMVARILCVVCQRPIRIGYLKHKTRNGETYNFSNTNYFHHLKMHTKYPRTSRGGAKHSVVPKTEDENSSFL